MTALVLLTPEAEAQIRTIDAWWRANRSAAPGLFTEELAAAFELLATAPQLGRAYRHPTVPGVRRVLLRATRHHVYMPGLFMKRRGPGLKPRLRVGWARVL